MRRAPTHLLIAGLTAITLLTAGCGSGDGPASASSDDAPGQTITGGETDVRIKDFVYRPAELTVEAGTTVSWTNDDFFGHTVTSGTPRDQTDRFDGVLGEVANAEGMGFTFTFEEPGTYDYFCRFHPRMRGTITVTG